MSSAECLDELNELNEINGCCAAVLESTNSDRFLRIHSIVARSRGNEGFDPPPITDHCCDDAASHGLKQGLLHVARATPAPRKKSLAESRCHREEDLSLCLHPGSRSTRSRASRSFLAGGVVSSSVIIVHVLEGERRNTFIYSQSRTSSIPDCNKYHP